MSLLFVILILNFTLLFLLFSNRESSASFFTKWIIATVKSMLAILVLICLITEILSAFHLITVKNIFNSWGLVAIFLALLLFKQNKKSFFSLNAFGSFDKNYISIIYASLLLIVLPLLFIAIFFPSTNSDALGYHIPRIEHWIQNCSVGHYLTNDIRQLFTPPLAEFLLLHIRILSGTDFWMSLVQFFAMIGSIGLVSQIIKLFKLDYKYQIIGGLLTLAISMGIMQSTSTQTDYVAAFCLVSFIYFFLKLMKSEVFHFSDVIFSAMAIGLGVFAKSTVVVFAAPFAILASIKFIKKFNKKIIMIGVVFLFFVLLINLPLWIRNFRETENILGNKSYANLLINEKMSLKLFCSNSIRIISMHTALPLANRVANRLIEKFHENILGISTEEESITFCHEHYEPFFCMNEDCLGNFFIVALLIFILFYALFNIKKLWAQKKIF